jgi:hypothetical protein
MDGSDFGLIVLGLAGGRTNASTPTFVFLGAGSFVCLEPSGGESAEAE